MSAPQFRCPHCATPILLPPTHATRFQCPQCARIFDLAPAPPAPVPAVPEAVPLAESPFEEVPTVWPQPVPVFAPPEPVAEADDEGDWRPRDRERREDARRKDSGAKVAILACVGALALVGAVLGGYFAFRAPAKEQAKSAPPPAPAPAPKVAPKVQPPLTREQMISKVKSSTVFVRTYFRGGLAASGSGFFAGGKPGYVVTNAHVIGYGPLKLREPEKVEVVVDNGLPGERAVTAKIFGLDAHLDLAVLRVEMRDVPAPLSFGKAEDLVETQEVVAFGYPFGERLGKNVSINHTTVSSLRKANGSVETVQLAGGLNPGNSGGPVTNAKGEVVGVGVAGFRGAEAICFAIPAEVADRFVDDMHACGGELRLGYLKFLKDGKEPKGPGDPPEPK